MDLADTPASSNTAASELRTSIALPFDPLTAKAPDLGAEADARPIGGLGIHLVRAIMDRVAYERVGGTNRLLLEKDI